MAADDAQVEPEGVLGALVGAGARDAGGADPAVEWRGVDDAEEEKLFPAPRR